jgi:hypothetical protein
MKKVTIIILIIMLVTSCSMTIKDPEGWEIYQVGWTLEEGTVLIQSHDGFRWGEYLLNETIKQTPVEIHNVLDRVIKVKITLPQTPSYWVDIAPLSSITIQTLTQSDNVL